MARFWICLLLVGLILGCKGEPSGSSDSGGASGSPGPSGKAGDEQVDVLKLVKAMNAQSDKISSKWRKGHVTARKLDPKLITTTKNGFSIQLPSGAPVPTPTIYKGKLYVGGGFHSKEFYCFDGKTGKFIWGINVDDDGPSSAVVEDDVCVFNTESCTIFAVDANTGKMLWSWWLGDPLMTTPTIHKGKVYTSYPAMGGGGGGGGGQVLPQAAPNGQQQEQVQQKEAGNKNAAPAIKAPAPGTVKVKGKDGKERTITLHPTHVMACFDLKTGKVLWQRWIDSDVMSAAVAVDDEIFFSTFAGTVYKFKTDGQIVSALRSRATSAPVVVGEDVYFTRRDDDADGTVREAISGNRRDSFAQKSQILSRKAVYLDKTVQSNASFKTKSAQLDADNGFGGGAPASANAQEALSNIGYANVSSLQAFQGSRILHMQSCNFNTMGNQIFCNDPRTGKMLWSYQLGGDQKKTGGFMGTAPAAAGGDLFVATIKGEILQLNAKDGKVRKTYKVGSPVRFQPVVMNGRIYVGTQDGKVICINTGDKKLTGWSTWGGNAQHTGVQH